MVERAVAVGPHRIGPGHPLFFIAEIGLNHNQDLGLAKELIDVAVGAGCSAAKFQTFRTEDVYVGVGRAGTYRLMGRDIPIYELHEGLEMSAAWVAELKAHCDERGIVFFSAPIGTTALELLDAAQTPAFKISSYELTNLPFVEEIARRGRSVILSSGAASLGEVEAAVEVLRAANCPVALMHCVTQYPAPFEAANLAAMDTLRAAFEIPVGFSDNGFVASDGTIDALRVPRAAAQAGADLFEVHITLRRDLPGPDHGFATEPEELVQIVACMNECRAEFNAGVRTPIDAELLGSSAKHTLDSERYVRDFAFKSIFAIRDIEPGERLTRENTRVLRPGAGPSGVAPAQWKVLLENAVARHPLGAWEPVTWDWLLG